VLAHVASERERDARTRDVRAILRTVEFAWGERGCAPRAPGFGTSPAISIGATRDEKSLRPFLAQLVDRGREIIARSRRAAC